MSGIVYDARKIMALEGFMALCEYTGKTKEWSDQLWTELVNKPVLMKEFMYYLDHHTFLDEYSCEGYSLTDLYVWQMSRYNLIRDVGKNTAACNKESMVLNAFRTMVNLMENPVEYRERIEKGQGMDQL